MTENNSEQPEYKVPSGPKSLILLVLFLVTFVPVNLWHDANYSGPGDVGMGALMGILMIFLWLPLLIASIVYAIKAIAKREGRTQGILTLSLIVILTGLSVILS